MPRNRLAQLSFLLVVGVTVVIIGRNLFRRYVNNALVAAVRSVNVSAVRQALARGADPNCRVSSLRREEDTSIQHPAPPLPILDLALFVDESNSSVSVQSLMHDAPAREIVKLLVLKGANVHNINYLEQACNRGDVALTRFLLDHGAGVDLADNPGPVQSVHNYLTIFTGPNPTQEAISAETNRRRPTARQLIQLLVAHGARLPLPQAQEVGDTAAVRAILRASAPIDAEEAIRAMLTAVNDGDMETIRSLLRRGQGANAPPEYNIMMYSPFGPIPELPLHAAVRQGRIDIARMLLAHGTDPNLTSQFDREPVLTAAVKRHDPVMIRLLLAHGANPNTPDGNSPLASAAGQGRFELLKLLLAKSAIPNVGGYSPALEAAVVTRRPSMVRYLLDHGASTATNPNSAFPLLSVALRGLPDVVPDLLRHSAPVNVPPQAPKAPTGPVGRVFRPTWVPASPLMAAVWYAPQYEATLVKAGANIGWDRSVACVEAARQRRLALLPKLLAYGADINGTDLTQDTALWVCIQSDPKNVQTLLEHGANPNIRSRDRGYPLELATILGRTEAVRLLLAHSANVNARYPHGHTALYWARRKRRTAILALLQQAGATE